MVKTWWYAYGMKFGGFRNLLHIVWNLENDQKSNIWYKTLRMTQMHERGMKLMFDQKSCYQLATT